MIVTQTHFFTRSGQILKIMGKSDHNSKTNENICSRCGGKDH